MRSGLEPQLYEIRVRGHLRGDWTGWFDGFRLRRDAGGVTVLSGLVVDQAALHGLVAKLRDLNLELISLNPVEGGHS